jgi:16S rRNA (cytosine967-C5)-methyltransferase
MAGHPREQQRALSADARAVAIEVLRRVDQDGAWASRALDAELQRRGTSGRDAALAAEIVYGTLRTLPWLDARLETRMKRGGRVDALTRAALRVGLYQLQHLSRVPPHAAVNASVNAVRELRGQRVAGFVNAVLRGLARDRPAEPAPPERVALPAWLERSLEESLGPERAASLTRARPLPPPLDLRVSAGRSVDDVLARLRDTRPDPEREGPVVERLAASPRSLRVQRAGDPRQLPGFEDGDFVVQEIGSQLIAALVGAQPGEAVADACAGRGGKTLQLAEAVGASGHVTALELHEARLEQIPAALALVGCSTPVELVCADLEVGCAGLEGRLDRVLIDAPCTGVGTFHRRPELLLRLTPEDPARLGALQARLLANAARMVRPGGLVHYAVCSPLVEEGAHVAAKASEFGLRPLPFDDTACVPPDADGAVRLGPWTPGVNESADAYQVFRFIR